MTKLVLEQETYEILGACFEVYKDKGCGFLEAVYQECLTIEFELRRIPAKALVTLPLTYKGRALRKSYEADFICYDQVLVELKAVSKLADEHRRSDSKPSPRDRPEGRPAGEFRALSQSRA